MFYPERRGQEERTGIADIQFNPPSFNDGELAILGAMLNGEDQLATAIGLLIDDDFYFPNNKKVYSAIRSLFERGVDVGYIAIKAECERLGYNETDYGGIAYLTMLSTCWGFEDITNICLLVIEKHMARMSYDAGIKLSQKAFDPTEDIFETIGAAQEELLNVVGSRDIGSTKSARTIVSAVMDNIEAALESGDHMTGIPTGFKRLDKITTGWAGGDLIVVAGRTSMGKTALATKFAVVAAKADNPVLMICLEMTDEQMIQRILSGEARVSHQDARTGWLQADDMDKLERASKRIAELPIYINQSAGSLTQVLAKTRQAVQKHGIKMMILDYLQLMDSNAKSTADRARELGSITRSLKRMAKDLGIVIIAISQLSRVTEQRQTKRPEISDLRESGRIEEDADTVTLVWRPERYGKNFQTIKLPNDLVVSSKGLAEIIVGKQRNGPVGQFVAAFVDKYVTFEEYEYTTTTN